MSCGRRSPGPNPSLPEGGGRLLDLLFRSPSLQHSVTTDRAIRCSQADGFEGVDDSRREARERHQVRKLRQTKEHADVFEVLEFLSLVEGVRQGERLALIRRHFDEGADAFSWHRALRASPVVIAAGIVQHERGALHLIVERVTRLELGAPSGAAEGLAPEDVPAPAKVYR